MQSTRRNAAAALLLAAGLAGAGTVPIEPTVTNGGVVPYVQRRIRDWLPDRDERRMDEIGWCRTLLEAERLGKVHGRPVLLFTLDGRMDLGRC